MENQWNNNSPDQFASSRPRLNSGGMQDLQQSVEKIIDGIENGLQLIERLFTVGQSQKQTITDIKDKAKVAVAPVLDRSQKITKDVSVKVKQHPAAFALGASFLVLGFFFLRKALRSESEVIVPETIDSTRFQSHVA